MPFDQSGRWRLVIIPGDHEPRHVHARMGTGRAPEAIIELNVDRTVSLREARGITRADLRQALAVAHEHFDQLAAFWELYC